VLVTMAKGRRMATPPLHKCPQCRQPTVWEGNADRPFCSERCRLLDLGAWVEERYCIATGTAGLLAEDQQEEKTSFN
jgi:hypothetical protein